MLKKYIKSKLLLIKLYFKQSFLYKLLKMINFTYLVLHTNNHFPN